MMIPEQRRSLKRIVANAAPLAASCRLLCSQVRISGLRLSVNELPKGPPLYPNTFTRLVKLGTGLLIVTNETSERLLLKLIRIAV